MAKLDQILLKSSRLSREDLLLALNGEGDFGVIKLEPGELVIRQDFGFIELFGADGNGEAAPLSVDIAGQLPDWSKEELKNSGATLSDLEGIGDVNLKNDQDGYVLTWDGEKWVGAPIPEFGENEGNLVPSLQDIGDVNLFWDYEQNKPDTGPEVGDTLVYTFNEETGKFFFATAQLAIENIRGFDIISRSLLFKPSEITLLEFGGKSARDNNRLDSASENGISLRAGDKSWRRQPRIGLFRKDHPGGGDYADLHDVEIAAGRTILFTHGGENDPKEEDKWTSWEEPFVELVQDPQYMLTELPNKTIKSDSGEDEVVPKLETIPNMAMVRNDWKHRKLSDIGDIDVLGIKQGQVLTWDVGTQSWVPTSGVAADISYAGINELSDVNVNIGRIEQRPLMWDNTSKEWRPQQLRYSEIKSEYNDTFGGGSNNKENPCPECNEENAGRVVVVENLPYICLKVRSSLFDENNQARQENDTWDYVRLQTNGYETTENKGAHPPIESSRIGGGVNKRTDPLSTVAYEGTLNSLDNVSPGNLYNLAALVWNESARTWTAGVPQIYLGWYSLGQLGNVTTTGAGDNYVLTFDRREGQWKPKSIDVNVRMSDMQDVGFGTTGVENTKLVAAYPLQNPATPSTLFYEPKEDLSPLLSTSTKKENMLGPVGFNQYGAWLIPSSLWPINQQLDYYIRWGHDPAWQEIDGDGCIEIQFVLSEPYYNTRTILKKNASASSKGGYLLQILESGAIAWSVNGPTGFDGFYWESPPNTVAIGEWHHVALVKEVDQVRLYFNGYRIFERTVNSSWQGDGLFVLGRNDLDDNQSLTHHFFRGLMANLRVTKGRPKYTGDALTIPQNIQAEILDQTPQEGDFLSYQGGRWTNVDGVEADISNKPIGDLSDVDLSDDPVTGDALVWTGNRWEAGIPGIGATWSLNDMKDVSTSYGRGAGGGTIQFNQAEALVWSNAFVQPDEEQDQAYLFNSRGSMHYHAYSDSDYSCAQPGKWKDVAPFADAMNPYIGTGATGQMVMRGERITINNKFTDCFLIPREHAHPVLHYAHVPNSLDFDDIGDAPEDTLVPPWGTITAYGSVILQSGCVLSDLVNVSTMTPTSGQALIWDGNNWTPSSNIAADISLNSISDLADVEVGTTPPDDFVLTWDYASSKWVPKQKGSGLFNNIEATAFGVSNSYPISRSNLHSGSTLEQAPQNGEKERANTLLDLAGNFEDDAPVDEYAVGIRGISFNGEGESKAHLYTSYGDYSGSTLLSSPIGESTPYSWIELNGGYARLADNGLGGGGGGGFRLGDGWRIVQEKVMDWSSYDEQELPTKYAISQGIATAISNFNMNAFEIGQLKNVNESGKAVGYALAWNGTNWAPSNGVAADISLSNSYELRDIEGQANSSLSTNDGWLSFDKGVLTTSRPHLSEFGGLQLVSIDWDPETADPDFTRIGWSETYVGSPGIYNEKAGLDHPTYVEVRPQEVEVNATQGIKYKVEPALQDLTVPTYSQVRQEIARQGTDYVATFFMDGNSYLEKNYGWDLDMQVSTTDSPLYFSKFDGEWSLNFRRINQDRFEWSTANGAPYDWAATMRWSVEFLVYIDQNTAAELQMEYIVCPKGDSNLESWSDGLHIGLIGEEGRDKLFATLGRSNASSIEPDQSYVEATIPKEEWVHVYFAHEGGGTVALFINGVRADEMIWNQSWVMTGGWSFGGQQRKNGGQVSYFTGLIDDLRITRGWLPYTPSLASVPNPVDPLQGSIAPGAFGRLGGLNDVNLTANPPTQGQVLTYNSLADQWEPASEVAYDVSANSIADLSDVDTDLNVAGDGDVMVWKTDTNSWKRSRVDGNGGVNPKVKRTPTPGVVPSPGTLFAGELFLNMADKKLYALDANGDAFTFAQAGVDQYTRIVGGDF